MDFPGLSQANATRSSSSIMYLNWGYIRWGRIGVRVNGQAGPCMAWCMGVGLGYVEMMWCMISHFKLLERLEIKFFYLAIVM